MNTQFVKVPTAIKPAKLQSLSALGLYALEAAMLSIPHFEASHGGFKEALKKHCCDGVMAFETAWKSLKTTGYQKMMRIPVDHNQFYYRYELRSVPDAKTPAVQNMTASYGRAYLSKERELYHVPQTNYTAVSCPALMDDNLSSSAKGLYILIRQELDLARNLKIEVKKSNIMKKCKEGKFAFNTAWKQLKDCNYLIQTRVIDPATGKINYEYELDGNPAETDKAAVKSAQKATHKKVSGHMESAVTDDLTPSATPHTVADRKAVAEIVRANIQYEDMLRYAHTAPLYYGKEDIDGYVKLMVDTICTRKATVRVNREDIPAQAIREQLLKLDCNHIRYVMEQLQKYPSKESARGFKLTALYNAADTYGEYALGQVDAG